MQPEILARSGFSFQRNLVSPLPDEKTGIEPGYGDRRVITVGRPRTSADSPWKG